MPTEALNILFLSPWYPHRYDPMFGLFVERHAMAAAIKNQVFAVFAFADPNLRGKAWELDVKQENGYTALRYYYPKSASGIRALDATINMLRYLKAHRKAVQWLDKQGVKIDVSHVNILTRAGYVALRLKRKRNIPYIITEHWSRYQPGKVGYEGVVRKWLTRKVVKNASMVFTVTQNLATALKAHRLNHPDYRTIYNVVDMNMFYPVESTPHTIKRIIQISCFEEKSKNLTGIVRAIKLLSERRQDFVVEMVGEGHDRDATIQLAKDLGVNNRFIFFPGLVEGKPLGEKLASADFLIIFSNYENLPVVINEAMACGKPVVSSDVGGIREILTSDKGLLVAPGDLEGFVNAMDKMLDNFQSYSSADIHAFAEAHFSQPALSYFLDKAYREATDGK